MPSHRRMQSSKEYSWHVTTHTQLEGTSALPVMTTRKDTIENHHPPHSKSAAPSLSAWCNKGNPFLHRWSLFKTSQVFFSGGTQLTNSGPNKREREKSKPKTCSHLAVWTLVFSRVIFNPPFQQGTLASCTQQSHQCEPLKAPGSSSHASFSKVTLLWLEVALGQAVMTQGYSSEALSPGALGC